MAEKSFLKCHCPKQNRYFGVTLEKFGGKWEATDFIPLEADKAKILASLVEQPYFETHKNLLPCQYEAGNRRLCSSSRVPCPASRDKYSFQCIYCNKLNIDYTSDLSGSGYREGDTITLSQGQEVKISSMGHPLEELELDCGWDPAKTGKNMDIDSHIFMFGGSEQEAVYFGQLDDAARSVHHNGDNLTGAPIHGQSDIDESININLKKVPTKYNQIAVVITIYEAIARGQDFGSVKNLFIRLFDKKSRKTICDYQVSHNISGTNVIVIGLLSRKGSDWSFKATGDAFKYSSSFREYKDYVLRKYRQ